MAGSKRNKIKRVLSPTKNVESPPPIVEDDDLMDDLFAQLESKDRATQETSAEILKDANIESTVDNIEKENKKDSKSRFKARQARKAAALVEQYAPSDAEADARLEREAREEERAITQTCDELGVKMVEINPDGHCLFSAIADQLAVHGIIPPTKASYPFIRLTAADYIQTHPDDFLPFLPSTLGEDVAGAESEGLMSPREFEQYCTNIRDTAVWGGEPEILALSRAFNVPIHVIQGAKPHVVVHNPQGEPPQENAPIVRISYHRRMYGLGEHYNSLRPKISFKDGIKAMFSPSSSLSNSLQALGS
ncbi:cysteine proteinase [Irpex rosettiformis]|uniref:Cysteine proteinase n=1 Tax=Irpex rosettiformis TaxID=378272 RepID=A0ACB8UGY2_9APHY|nr:cysteine proteinase [Irpex rosettiformis]